MLDVVIYTMIYVGSAVMLFNVFGFFLFAYNMAKENRSKKGNIVYYVPFILVVLFLLGYLGVAIWGKPDLLVAAILFGGAIYVFIMYFLTRKIIAKASENEALKVKLLAAEESQKAKANFLADVSHEMRTPLNVILGLNAMALKDPLIREETKQKLLRLDANAKQLLGLVNNVIDMSAIETGELGVKEDEFLLEAAVNHVSEVAEASAKEKDVRFTLEIEESAKGYYSGDESRIKQVLGSLLDNAIKYTDAKGEVALRVSREGENTRFCVVDTGIGMDECFLSHVFEVFTKEDSGMRTTHSGSGLGLAVTKGIVDLLGGRIEAQSKKGVGSTFTVTLPLRKLERNPDDAPTLEGKRILIAEDIPDNAEIVIDLLELEGAICEHAENGKIALDKFAASESNYYDCILMDLRMPVMDGLSATRAIRGLEREDAKRVPIIALTANAFESDVRESLSAGMDAHLSKPADSDKLYATIRMVLKKKK